MIIYVDGACRGNPGPAAIGALLEDESGKPLAQISRRIGWGTNNQAEYQALIAALEQALRLGAREVDIRMDSSLVVEQIRGRYRVKNASLRPLWQRALSLLGEFQSYRITHIPREQNQAADRLANRALDV